MSYSFNFNMEQNNYIKNLVEIKNFHISATANSSLFILSASFIIGRNIGRDEGIPTSLIELRMDHALPCRWPLPPSSCNVNFVPVSVKYYCPPAAIRLSPKEKQKINHMKNLHRRNVWYKYGDKIEEAVEMWQGGIIDMCRWIFF